MMDAITFTVPGAAIGKQRHRSRIAKMGNGKQFIANYTPKETVNFENLVKLKAQEAMSGQPPMDGPVELSLWVFVVPPVSWSQKKTRSALAGEIIPTTKPDLSNVVKAVEDGMNGIVFLDDKQVSDYGKCRKRYGQTPGITVSVKPINLGPTTIPLL